MSKNARPLVRSLLIKNDNLLTRLRIMWQTASRRVYEISADRSVETDKKRDSIFRHHCRHVLR